LTAEIPNSIAQVPDFVHVSTERYHMWHQSSLQAEPPKGSPLSARLARCTESYQNSICQTSPLDSPAPTTDPHSPRLSPRQPKTKPLRSTRKASTLATLF